MRLTLIFKYYERVTEENDLRPSVGVADPAECRGNHRPEALRAEGGQDRRGMVLFSQTWHPLPPHGLARQRKGGGAGEVMQATGVPVQETEEVKVVLATEIIADLEKQLKEAKEEADNLKKTGSFVHSSV